MSISLILEGLEAGVFLVTGRQFCLEELGALSCLRGREGEVSIFFGKIRSLLYSTYTRRKNLVDVLELFT